MASEAAYLALGITEEGEREVLGFWLLPAESSTGWGDPPDGAQRTGA